MQTTVVLAEAPFTESDHEFTLHRGRDRRPAARRGAGPGRGDRPVPHRPDRADHAAGGDVPDRDGARGHRRGRGRRRRGARDRGRRPRRHELPVLPRAADRARRATWATASSTSCSTTWACGPTARRRCAAASETVFGSFFGQSSFARHALAYADNCVVVPEDLDLALLAPFGCGFQTGAGTVLNVLRPTADESLVVFGAGAVGLAAIAAACGAGVGTVIAVDPVAARRQLAEGYGARALDPTLEDAGRRPGQGADRRRGVVRHRHDGDRGRRAAGPALAALPRDAGRARTGCAGVPDRRDRPAAVGEDRPLVGRGRLRSAADDPGADPAGGRKGRSTSISW